MIFDIRVPRWCRRSEEANGIEANVSTGSCVLIELLTDDDVQPEAGMHPSYNLSMLVRRICQVELAHGDDAGCKGDHCPRPRQGYRVLSCEAKKTSFWMEAEEGVGRRRE